MTYTPVSPHGVGVAYEPFSSRGVGVAYAHVSPHGVGVASLSARPHEIDVASTPASPLPDTCILTDKRGYTYFMWTSRQRPHLLHVD